MATSVDTNVISFLLLDADATKADAAQRGLEQALARGRILVCGPVFSELLAAGAWDAPTLRSSLADMRFDLELDFDAAIWAGAAAAYSRYLAHRRPADYTCPVCGTSQRFRCRQCHQDLSRPKHVLSDFLIGAHALQNGHDLLTDDTGLYADFFPDLRVLPI